MWEKIIIIIGCSLISFSLSLNTWAVPQQIYTNQNYLEAIRTRDELNIQSIDDVFQFIFNQLPDEVTVYPTENYYYYSFYHNGIELSGNIRLDALDRDKGIVHFAYFSTYNRWNEELINKYKKFAAKDNLQVKKISDLRYQLTLDKKSVIFNLNDLRNITPPASKIRKDEQFIGPVFDESGIQFYLVYNPKVKRFYYILNEHETVPDTFTPSRISNDILIGTRTGFSFYRDNYKNRLILIGVYAGNSMVNNYFDGPFDQLPDNFIKGDQLKNAFIDQRPELKGEIDRFGNTDNGASRVLITPYIHYSYEQQLSVYKDCTQKAGKNINAYYSCFEQEEPDLTDYGEE
ncbi:hypothetical protein [Legionella israelensis]|uniref:Uncharacterized protein n=1 Tax=Legionella israelensis TaxID=454 RepID=A0A0W0WDS1_9GAMM|nr:hypothetical protein [Legionella israelensis]KTD30517.1 hypothetical protein Lisr_0731 [Legionella israelensis]QBS09059.1 hypothetical protein E4T55_03840 [Legionella israelensis]SCY51426.1 hypothetical protein SAMN02746069_02708 [Legionella israelensis DSM 19235]STX58776.1 Uncharacterised protein [Legionella israelensis]